MSRQPRAETRNATGRAQRVPLGVPRDKMAAEQRKGYVRRWINDVPGRVQAALKAGYQLVQDPTKVGEGAEDNNTGLGTAVSMNVGTHENGHPMKAYLMEIKKEWYEQDQAEKQKQVDETDNAIRRGKHGQDQEGRYIPKGGIKIS